ncbi:MAG TPA: FG-GAP repeat protein, partial [Anaerolineaceae bacterium]|nr:FG-GAP repeat protein [Anaerolineaceae bacterium]
MSGRNLSVRILILFGLVFSTLPWTGTPVSAQAAPIEQSGNNQAIPEAAQAVVSATLGQDDARYHLLRVLSGYRIEQPDGNLKAEFTPEAAIIEVGGLEWNLHLQAWGPDKSLSAVESPIELVSEANRIEYRYAGLTEWFVNGPSGLQQGFTVYIPTEQDEISLKIGLNGLNASLDEDLRSATVWTSDHAAMVSYTGLTAFDANWKPLKAWMELLPADEIDATAQALILHVDTAGAVFPVTIDPMVQQRKLLPSSASGDNFGFSVSSNAAGTIVAVGAYDVDDGLYANCGAVYIFVSNGGAFTQQARLIASVPQDDARFGISVDLSDTGSYLVVGSYLWNQGAEADQGAAYIFFNDAGIWSQQAFLLADDGGAGDKFGWTTSIAGNGAFALIGAHGYDSSDAVVDNGQVYLFSRSGSTWSLDEDIVFVGSTDGAKFGYS